MIMRGVTGINNPSNTGPSYFCKDILLLLDYKFGNDYEPSVVFYRT